MPLNGATVDHFIPISQSPQTAYEWNNYRLSCARANTNKGDNRNVLDPFNLKPDSFSLDFPSLLLRPNPSLDMDSAAKVSATIAILGLNEEYFVEDRLHWLIEYLRDSDIDFLKRHAPFLAYELQRQKLESTISAIMWAP